MTTTLSRKRNLMKVKISIDGEWDLSDPDIFDEEAMETEIDTRVDYLIERFLEDVDSAVRYNELRESIRVEYIED